MKVRERCAVEGGSDRDGRRNRSFSQYDQAKKKVQSIKVSECKSNDAGISIFIYQRLAVS